MEETVGKSRREERPGVRGPRVPCRPCGNREQSTDISLPRDEGKSYFSGGDIQHKVGGCCLSEAARANDNRNNNFGGRCAPRLLPPSFEEVVSLENLYFSFDKVIRGKRSSVAVCDFIFFKEKIVRELHHELISMRYRVGKYTNMILWDSKRREIAVPPFRDRVVNFAVSYKIRQVIEDTFIADTYASIPDRGMHKALDRAQGWARRYKWVLHCDIKKFFDSISHRRLKAILQKFNFDKRLFWLIHEIINSYWKTQSRGDKRGLALGNMSSQIFANLYLGELDKFVIKTLKIPGYVRYMDDFLIFGQERDQMYKIRSKIKDFLFKELSLDLHMGKSQAWQVERGFKFLGVRIFPDKRKLPSSAIRRVKYKLRTKLMDDYGLYCWLAYVTSVGCGTKNSRRLLFQLGLSP